MTLLNPIKHKFKNVFESLLAISSVARKLTNDQKECMKFGICDFTPRQVGKVPAGNNIHCVEYSLYI